VRIGVEGDAYTGVSHKLLGELGFTLCLGRTP
jgi:hypothetical protein